MDSRRLNLNRKKLNNKLFCGILLLISVLLTACGNMVFAKDNDVECKWKYIVIHHSATSRGNALIFAKYHSGKRGMQNGLAYHFVIDNGTCGKRDGQLEIGERWTKQKSGGHARQDWVNQSGIGICLVGNFNNRRPSLRQMRTLINLVRELQKRYNIPINNVIGHGKIKGEKTQCPGKYFPWDDFYSALKNTK